MTSPAARSGRRHPDLGVVIFVGAVLLLVLVAGQVLLRQRGAGPSASARHRFLENPYRAQPFHKGQLHVQSSRAIGHGFPRDVAHAYQRLGYEWMAITDINTLTPTDQFTVPGTAALRGTEAAFPFGHLLDFAVDEIPRTASLQQNIDFVRGQAGLTILAHPNVAPAVTAEQALNLRNIDAVEIFDARVAREQPSLAEASDTWDRLLSAGHRVWGVVGDDSIELEGPASTIGQTSVDVQAPGLSEALVLEAVRSGAFVAGAGVRILGVDTSSGDTIRVITTNATSIHWYGRGGRLLATTRGSAGDYRVRWEEGYVRAVAEGPDGARGWTQPVFVVP